MTENGIKNKAFYTAIGGIISLFLATGGAYIGLLIGKLDKTVYNYDVKSVLAVQEKFEARVEKRLSALEDRQKEIISESVKLSSNIENVKLLQDEVRKRLNLKD